MSFVLGEHLSHGAHRLGLRMNKRMAKANLYSPAIKIDSGHTRGGAKRPDVVLQATIGRTLSRFPSLSEQHCDLRNILASRRLVVVDARPGFASEERGRWAIPDEHASL
jgi:hypothetical protein